MPDQNPELVTPIPTTAKPRSLLRRIGCSFGLIFWILLLLTPCFCLVLASQGEISIRLGDVPGQSFRIWLVNEARERGIAVAWPTLHSISQEGNLCLQIDVKFVLWMGQGNETSYCDCYAQLDNQWSLTSTLSGICPSG